MKQFSKDLGRVSVVPSGAWNADMEYEKLSVVYDKCTNLSYIAKVGVPVGASIDNREYWQPMNVSGYADNNFVNLTTVSKDGTITAYENINEAITAVVEINRKPGAVLSFYNINSDRLDAQPEFELWQFNSTDLTNWENEEYWNNIYFNWNVFVGWYVGADALKKHVANPNVGQYAYVGTSLNDALLYQCRTNGTWTNAETKVRDHISVVVKGNVEIGENGNWISNGKDTGIPATPKVDETLDSITKTLVNYQVNFDKQTLINTELKSQIQSNSENIVKTNNRIDESNKIIDKFALNIDKLNDTVYPITLGFSVIPNTGITKNEVKYSISSEGKPFTPDTLEVTKQVNDNPASVLATTPISSGSLTTDIQGNREIFNFSVTKQGRTGKSASQTKYLCYYGVNSAQNITKEVINSLTKVSTAGVSFNPIITTKNNDYIWIVVPNYLTIKNIKSAGFDVLLSDVQIITTSLGIFKAYRTVNTLTAQTWTLVIS